MAHVLTDISDKIPENLRQVFSILSGEVLWLREKWLNYNHLYGHSQERISGLNECGSTFFYMVDHLFIDDFILTLCRLTDYAEGRNSNLSLQQLIAKLDPKIHSQLLEKLVPLYDNLQKTVANPWLHRHKRVAHADLKTLTTPDDTLPPVSRELIERAMAQSEEFLQTFEHHFSGSHVLHAGLKLLRGSDILLSKLAKARAYEKLEKDGKIPYGTWRDPRGGFLF